VGKWASGQVGKWASGQVSKCRSGKHNSIIVDKILTLLDNITWIIRWKSLSSKTSYKLWSIPIPKAQVFQIEYVLHNERGITWDLENAIFDDLETRNFQNIHARRQPRWRLVSFIPPVFVSFPLQIWFRQLCEANDDLSTTQTRQGPYTYVRMFLDI
jgi:hypothetical protein